MQLSKKIHIHVILVMLGFSCIASGIELSFSNIHSVLNNNKNELEDCGIQVKSKGKKINPLPEGAPNAELHINLDDNYFNINEQECRIENSNEKNRLICSYRNAENQSIRVAGVYLQIDFDENGDFLESGKRYSTGLMYVVRPDGDRRQACKSGEEPRAVERSFFSN